MNATQSGISCCQRCRYYASQGRRGGHCEQLSVPVQGKWSPCPLAAPFFVGSVNTMDTVTELPVWPEVLVLPPREAVPAKADYVAKSA